MKALRETANRGTFARRRLRKRASRLAKNPHLSSSLQANLENSFGHSFAQLQIHKNSKQAEQINARAFTKGEHVHFASGQFDTNTKAGKELIGHELAHVVQQREGKVSPTHSLGHGIYLNESAALEHEAERQGKQAVNGDYTSDNRLKSPGKSNSGKVIQRAVNTLGGQWEAPRYRAIEDLDPNRMSYPGVGYRGAAIELVFTPKKRVDAEAIALIQTQKSVRNGSFPALEQHGTGFRAIDSNGSRMTQVDSALTDEGTTIDRSNPRANNPIYGAANLGADQGIEHTPDDGNVTQAPNSIGNNTKYELGYSYQDQNQWMHSPARLGDFATMSRSQSGAKQVFEVTALATRGNQAGTYYGSVKWGWTTETGKFKTIPLSKVNHGTPSSSFMEAARLWNEPIQQSGSGGLLPLQSTGKIGNTSLAALRTGSGPHFQTMADLPRDTIVTVLSKSPGWYHVQVDATAPGIIMNRLARIRMLPGRLLRGYVHRSLVQQDPGYER